MPAAIQKNPERRKYARLRIQAATDLGDLLDLSAGGARVRPRGLIPLREGDGFWFNIQGLDDLIRVAARVVWLKRKGWWGGREGGLEFVSLDAKTRGAPAVL